MPQINRPYAVKTLDDHLSPAGRKRILALDGGGVRGALELAILERIEELLRERYNAPDFRVSDYFDLIGGTSTGAIVASGLAAKRMSIADIKQLYFEMAPAIFRKGFMRLGVLRPTFEGKKLEKRLKNVFGGMTLGSSDMATGLAIISKRVDTDSTWVLHNHPKGKFFDDPTDDSYLGNKHYPLPNIIRASTAAPHYFKPEKITIIPGQEVGLFMDGGVTPHNNPSFQMMMLAGLRNYNYGWTLNADQLMLISIGTGSLADKIPARDFERKLQVAKTLDALTSMITGAEDFIELLMEWIGDSVDPKQIDSEVGDLRDDLIAGEPLVAYQRYQVRLTKDALKKDLGLSLTDDQIKTVRVMTDPDAMPIAYDIGKALAEAKVRAEHFPERFDLTRDDNPEHPADIQRPDMSMMVRRR